MVKGVVDKLARMESNQDKMARAPQPVVQPPVAPVQQGAGGGQQQGYPAAVAAGLK